MKVVYTAQSIASLEESLNFLIEEQGLSFDKAAVIKERLFDRADALAKNPKMGQQEKYLDHLQEGHRRIIEGHFKVIYKIEKTVIYIIDFF